MTPKYIEFETVYRKMADFIQPNNFIVLTALRETLDNAPAADVVEVVRCRECKHLCVSSGALGVYQCALYGDYPSGEYFCADGERKDGGQENEIDILE